ncbi:MAG TPA: hypothetical protein PK170_06480, partial [Anaerolineae bacterium]|nr:hypothetical protein [Anaerolineae bacterium]
SMADAACGGVCTWTRTVKATRAGTWTASYVTPTGMTLAATPSTFTLAAGQSQTLNIQANVAGLPLNQYAFGYVVLTPASGAGAAGDVIHLTVVVRPISGSAAISVTPASLAATQATNTTTSQTLNIANTGTVPLTWQIAEAPDALRLATGQSRGIQDAAAPRQVTIGDAALSGSSLTPGQTVTPERAATPDGLVTITHSTSQSIVTNNSVSCNAGGLHTDNSYLRQFDLNAFGITDTYNVTQVQIGVEQAAGAGGSQPITVNLYTKINPAGALTWANLTQIGTANATVSDQALTLLTVPVTGAAPAGSVLVVEVFTPNGQTAGHSFFIGSNAAGQTAPSYLAAADCGVVEPTDTAAIGFPGMHIVMNVTGDTAAAPASCDAPADVPWLTVAPTSGTTNAGGSSNVTVGFNSTGLANGVYNAVLCVTSNAPQTPLVEVPVSLTVEEQGGNVVEVCSTPNVAIPDNNPTGVSDTITVPDNAAILDLDVYIRAAHTWVGDVSFTLQHVETATTAVLVNRPGVPASTFGCSGDNYDVTVNDEGASTPIENQCANLPAITGDAPGGDPPNTSLLAAFDGQSTQGSWVLTATDAAGGDTGTLNEWCVRATVAGGDPNINVSPLSMASTQAPNTTTSQTLNVGNTGGDDLSWAITEEPVAAPELANWSDNFDSYATGSQLHGQGGWKGWANDPSAGALTSGQQFRSSPNSAAILGASDLVHEYAETSGQWVYTAWQYVPADFTGQTYFIMLNSYDDAGSSNNWSVQVMFNGAANTVTNDGGVSGGSLPLVRGQWVEIRVEIDLNADTGAFYYNNQLLYTGTWSGQVSGGGAAAIAAVDLFANGASVVYYDDMSLVSASQPTVCSTPSDIPWVSVSPLNGVTLPGGSTPVNVTFDSTGLAVGTYTGNLCVDSDDPDPGPGNGTDMVIVPVTLTVEQVQQIPNIDVSPLAMSSTQPANTTTQQLLNVANTGNGMLDWTIDEEDTTGFPAIAAGPQVAQ